MTMGGSVLYYDIQSFDYPFESLTPNMLFSFVKQLVRVDEQNYVLVVMQLVILYPHIKLKKK